MKQPRYPMELNYQSLTEFKIGVQDHHLEKNALLLSLSYISKHPHIGSFVDYSLINHTCHSSVTK